jgi:hypothetical protein
MNGKSLRKGRLELNPWCASSVFARHSGSPGPDQAACFAAGFFSYGTMGGSFYRPSASRRSGAGVEPAGKGRVRPYPSRPQGRRLQREDLTRQPGNVGMAIQS